MASVLEQPNIKMGQSDSFFIHLSHFGRATISFVIVCDRATPCRTKCCSDGYCSHGRNSRVTGPTAQVYSRSILRRLQKGARRTLMNLAPYKKKPVDREFCVILCEKSERPDFLLLREIRGEWPVRSSMFVRTKRIDARG